MSIPSMVPDAQQQEIRDLRIGDAYPIKRTYGLSQAVTVASVSIVIKRYFGTPDNAIMPVVSITASSTAAGQITDPGTTSSLLSIIALIPYTSTERLDDAIVYIYGVKGVDTNGNPYTFEGGKVYPLPDINSDVS